MRRTALAALAIALAATVTSRAHDREPSRFGWWSDVRPILARHCASCHRPGGAAPMSLGRYDEVLPWAAAIQREVLERRMPPWAPEEGHRAYRGERLLTAREIDLLADWTAGGTPEGPPDARAFLPRLVAPLHGENVRALALEAVELGPDESRKVACLRVSSPLAGTGWITGVEPQAGTPRLLRRATLWLSERCDDERPPLLVWVPGQGALERGDDSGDEWPAGASLSVRLEYVKPWDDDGRAVADASRLLVRLESAARRRVQRLEPRPVARLTGAARVVAMTAIAADRPGPLRVIAEAPGAAAEVLLELRDPDPLWLGRYEPVEAPRLPPGTALRVEGGRAVVEWRPASE